MSPPPPADSTDPYVSAAPPATVGRLAKLAAPALIRLPPLAIDAVSDVSSGARGGLPRPLSSDDPDDALSRCWCLAMTFAVSGLDVQLPSNDGVCLRWAKYVTSTTSAEKKKTVDASLNFHQSACAAPAPR